VIDSIPPSDDSPVLAATPEVVQALVGNHRKFLAFLERRVNSREVAEDILQEAFVRALPRAGELRDEESVVAWFYRSLRNALVDHYRKQGAEQRAFEKVSVLSDGAVPGVDAELMDTVCACAGELIATLKPEYAKALRRVDLGGASVKAWAEADGISANNASVRLHRARAALRQQVEKSCGTCADHGCLDCHCAQPAKAPQ